MVCKALADIIQPQLDEAFDNGFNNGKDEKAISIFKNMIKEGVSKEVAQKCAEISDQMVERALAEI